MSVSGDILVVDDYESWRILLTCLLEEDGHRVLTASNHSGAERMLRERAFDVVILDMRLVDEETYNVQGMQLLRQVKSQAPYTGAIILTGYPDPLHEQKALNEYGADAYLPKVPENEDFDIDTFIELVNRLVIRRRRGMD